jgi:arginyl-tRNA synthetase
VIKTDIEQAIASALLSLGAEGVPFVVERPGDFAHGDYATNAALAAAKILKKNPREVAEQLKEKLVSISNIEKTEVAGAGFINFFLTRDAVVKEVEAAATQKEWGSNELYKDKQVMVEYTDPNPFKEFHIGHLMSNAIGESVARVLEAAGAQVTRANYQGDVGLHVAKAIWGKQQKPELAWGAAYAYGSAEYENNKEDIDALNKKIYESDNSIAGLYEEGRNYSLAEFEKIYALLGTKFDKYFFESESWEIGLDLVKKNIGKVFEESDGAVVYKGEQDGLHTRVFLTKAGLTTYEAKDLGLLALKQKSGDYDLSVTVTASEQKEYFKVVLAAAKKIDEVKATANKTTHVTHGMMRFAEGKMSSRTGNVITGESLLMDLMEEAKKKMQGRELADAGKVAEQVAVGAIKYTVLKQGSGKDIIFDPEKSLSIEGGSGLYLQYAHTRALSLLKAAGLAGVEKEGETFFALQAPQPTVSPSCAALERTLVHYPDVVAYAAAELEPHYVTTYLTELAAAFNSWYASGKIIGSENEKYGILLAKAVEQTLSKGLQVLGVSAPEQM